MAVLVTAALNVLVLVVLDALVALDALVVIILTFRQNVFAEVIVLQLRVLLDRRLLLLVPLLRKHLLVLAPVLQLAEPLLELHNVL